MKNIIAFLVFMMVFTSCGSNQENKNEDQTIVPTNLGDTGNAGTSGSGNASGMQNANDKDNNYGQVQTNAPDSAAHAEHTGNTPRADSSGSKDSTK